MPYKPSPPYPCRALLVSAALAALAGLSGCDKPPASGSAPTTAPAATKPASDAGKAPADTSSTAAAPAGAATSSAGPIVIGVAAPLTGNSAAFGTQIRLGVLTAVATVNKAGGVNGRMVETVMKDDAGSAADAGNVATSLASDPRVMAVVGHFNSSCSNAGKEAYRQAGMVMFSPASTAVNVTKDSDGYVFRNIFTDDFQGRSLAEYAVTVLGAKKIAILFDNDDYGIGLKDSFVKRATELTADTGSATAYNKDTVDFRSQLTTIQGASPDAILVAGLYAQAATIAKQARELGIKAPFLGGDGVMSDEYMKLAGEAAEGAYVTFPMLFELAGDKAKAFRTEFIATNKGVEPDCWAALSYDAFMMIIEGLKKDPSRAGVRTYLKTINSEAVAYDGLCGKTFFDANGDCRKAVQFAVVKNGKFTAAEKQLAVK